MNYEGSLTMLSRRKVLGLGVAAGFGLCLPSVAVGPAFAQERGGTLNVAMPADPPNFDLLSNTTSRVLDSIGPCYNGLVQFDPMNPNEIIGDLATSWDVAEDGLSITFHLHKGVSFHDGMPMTSADVKYTFDVTRDPPAGMVSSRRNALSAVNAIETPDDLTVIFRLSRPSPGLIPSNCISQAVAAVHF